jgi:DNA-binding CsgD family transcriptional regulator
MRATAAEGDGMTERHESDVHTAQQLRVIAAMYKTGTAKEAGDLLGLSPQTVKNHLNIARRRAGVAATEDLYQMYWRALAEDAELVSTIGLNPRQIRYRFDAEYRERMREQAREGMRKIRDRQAVGLREHYERLLETQGNVCAICGQVEGTRRNRSGGFVRLSVDHDHATGQIRELLCSACNLMLGCAKDDPARLEAAVRYLRRHADGTSHNSREEVA